MGLPHAPVLASEAVLQDHPSIVPVVFSALVAFGALSGRREYRGANIVRDKPVGLENAALVEAFLLAAASRDIEPAVLAGGRLVVHDAAHFV